MIKKKLFTNINLISLSIIVLPFLFFVFCTYYLKIYFHHDALAGFETFKFINDYYFKYDEIPLWIPNLANGVNISSKLIFRGYEIISPYIFLGKYFNISSYDLYIFYIYFLYLISIFGIKKLILVLDIKSKKYCIFFASYLFLFTNLFFNEIIFTFLTNLFIPYYLYYFIKFKKNGKVAELFKIVILFLTKAYIFFFYNIITEFYLLLIFSIYFRIYKFETLNKIFSTKNYKYFFIIIILSLLIFFNIYLFSENYILKDFTSRDLSGNIFFNNYRFGDLSSLKIMFLTLFSGFFWGEASFIISFSGLLFIIISIFNWRTLQNFQLFKFSIYVILFSIIFSNFWLFPNLIKQIYFNIPLLNYHSHSHYNYLYGKTFILILVLYGFDLFISQKSFNKYIILQSLGLYLLSLILTFILSFYISKFYPKENLISVNLYSVPFIITLILIYLFKNNFFVNKNIVVFFVIISLAPSYLYNISNYSFSNSINFYKKEDSETRKIRNITNDAYKKIYFERNNFNYENNCLEPDKLYKTIPSTKIKEFIPRGSADYSLNLINSNLFQCSNFGRINILENKLDLNDLKFSKDDFNFSIIKNTYFFENIDNSKNNYITILPYSKNFDAYYKDKKLETSSKNGFLNIKIENADKITVKYNNLKIKIYLIISIIFSFFLNFIFFIQIKKFIFKNKLLFT